MGSSITYIGSNTTVLSLRTAEYPPILVAIINPVEDNVALLRDISIMRTFGIGGDARLQGLKV